MHTHLHLGLFRKGRQWKQLYRSFSLTAKNTYLLADQDTGRAFVLFTQKHHYDTII